MERAEDVLAVHSTAADGLQWPPPLSDGDVLWLEPVDRGNLSSTPANIVSLSHLLAFSAALEWHDAIAVVLGVADALRAEGSDSSSGIPSPDDILLESDGRFRVVPGSRPQSTLVRGLATVLNRLLRDKPLPVRLRLFTTVVDSVTSADEFLSEVARWERPGRQQKLVAVYERACAHHIDRPDEIASHPPAAAEPVLPPVQERPSSRRSLNRPTVVALIAVAVVLVATAITWSFWHRAAAHETVGDVAASGAQPASMTAADRTSGDVTLPPASRHVSASRRLPRSTVKNLRTRSRDRGHLAPVPVTGSRPNTLPADRATLAARLSAAGPPLLASVEPVQPPSRPAEPVDPERVFQTGDIGVAAPVLVKPHLPRRARTDIPISALAFLEIVVDTRGRVESVRLQSPANRYREKWWLFAAKDWQFTPAMKGGRPVRYLVRVPLTDLNISEPQ